MQQTQTPTRLRRRLLALALAAVMILGLVPGFPGADSEASAHWADPYLSQLVEWGFIRADQANNPDRALTRADFMAITNRAYGYATPGETPFEDVAETDWFYDDVGIAYNARYIKGTSPTTASPNSPLTRETAATILGRNMMLQESAGEILDFTDARQISNWAKGTIKSSLEHYLVSGYNDGTFRPQRNVSWGEMASLISNVVGTPLQEPGDYSLGGTFGNVTITSPGVTLRDTVISGDLYVTGGVGLGDVKLENVTVLGRIICSGTGSSEGGEASILLRNVSADEMLIDNLQDNKVSVKADGITEIGRTTVRTSAYIEDNTPDGLGLQYISIEGDVYPEGEEPEDWEPIQVDLAGRIGEVVNRTPESQVRAGRGTVAKLTVDEAATDSTVIIDRGAVVKELNLDTATIVSGEGDIEHLIVNAPGCEVEMLPDQITIRPGITAIIAGEEMDTVAAEESSMEPLILAGYPEARDITPTGLEAAFMTNKSGTVYWSVSPATEGSVGEDDLIKPPSYGSIAVAHGSVQSPKGNEEFNAMISGLTPGGSYYLSAILVDARDHRSPVKVVSFETPDNTVPAFCAGYPQMSSTSPKNAVAVVMPTKNCKLYYALMLPSAVAPTPDELKTNAVAGALGYGVMDVYKNEESTFPVNDVVLQEKTEYVVYFWLTDGVNSSAVIPLHFTTKDETPPTFIVEPTVTDVKATSVSMTFRLDEDGIVYWVAVPAGTIYPKPEPGTDMDTAPLTSDYAKLQIISGMNIGSNGKSGRVNAKANTDGTITVSGLQAETAYDFYYVAVDTAGNRSHPAGKKTINTLDTTGPKFTQSFSHVAGTDKTKDPMSDTAIYLDVSENIRYDGEGGGKSLLEIYQDTQQGTPQEREAAVNRLAKCLYGTPDTPAIVLHKVSAQDNSEQNIIYKWQTSDNRDNWAIDYTQAVITSRSGNGIRIEFPSSALHLENGGRYYFTIENIRDVSNNQNEIVPERVDFYRDEVASKAAGHNVPVFEVGMPRVDFSNPGVSDGPYIRNASGNPVLPTGGADPEYVRMDMSFRMTPVSTETVSDDLSYDVLLWTGNQLKFDLYYRIVDEFGKNTVYSGGGKYSSYDYKDPNGAEGAAATKIDNYWLPQHTNSSYTADPNGWIYLGNSGDINPTSGHESGRSVNKNFNGCGSTTFPKLKNLSSKLRYEFVIHITQIGDIPETQGDRETWRNWNENVVFHAYVAAGQSNNLNGIASDGTPTNPGGVTETSWNEALGKGLSGGALSIGRWYDAKNQEQRYIELSYRFTDSRLPTFTGVQFPEITPTTAKVEFRMSTAGMVYWMVGQADSGTNNTAEITTTRTLMQNADGTTASNEASTNQNDARTNAERTGALLQLSGSSGQYHIRLTDFDSNGASLAPPDPTKGESMQPWMIGTTDKPPLPTSVDDPETPNLIQSPNKNWVMNPNASQTTADALHGSKTAEGRRTENFTIEGLSPEKNYYLYVVVKGESDTLSHVYLYQFTTPKAVKPKIELDYYYKDDNNGGASISTDIDSRLKYLVVTLPDAQDSSRIPILNERIAVSAEYAANADNPSIVQNGSVSALDALLNTYNGEDKNRPTTDYGYSLFDVYATPTQKRNMSRFLRGESLQSFVSNPQEIIVDRSSGDMSLTGTTNGGRPTNQLLKLYKNAQFVIMAVARVPNPDSTDDAEVDSYKAYAPLRLGAVKPPVMETWDSFINLEGKTQADMLFPGYISLTFDEPMYFLNSSGQRTQLTASNASELLRIGTWRPTAASGQLAALADRIQATVEVTGSQTTITFENKGSNGGWANGDSIQFLATRLFNIGGVPLENNININIRKTTTSVDVTLTHDKNNTRTDSFPFAATQDLTLYIQVPSEASLPGLQLEGNPEATQTLYVDSKDTVNDIRFVSSIMPPQYAAYSQYAWESSRPEVLRASSNTNEADATFKVMGEGETTIRLRVSAFLPSGETKVATKEMKVIIGYTVTFSGAVGTGVSSDKSNWTTRVEVTPKNKNPEVTFTFNSVRSLPSTGLAASMDVPGIFTPATLTPKLSTDGKTVTVVATVSTVPTATTGQPKLTVTIAGKPYVVNITVTGTQNEMPGGGAGGGTGAAIDVNPYGSR